MRHLDLLGELELGELERWCRAVESLHLSPLRIEFRRSIDAFPKRSAHVGLGRRRRAFHRSMSSGVLRYAAGTALSAMLLGVLLGCGANGGAEPPVRPVLSVDEIRACLEKKRANVEAVRLGAYEPPVHIVIAHFGVQGDLQIWVFGSAAIAAGFVQENPDPRYVRVRNAVLSRPPIANGLAAVGMRCLDHASA